MLVAFGTFFLSSLYLLKNGPSAAAQPSTYRWLFGLVHEVTSLLLLGYVLARRGRRFRDLGLSWSPRDIGVTLIVAAVSYLSYSVGATALQAIHYALHGTLARSYPAGTFFADLSGATVPFFLLNPFFEELIVRAYLMTEIVDLTGSTTLAVVLSVALQVSYHLYYGWWGALSVGFSFLIFALYYARWRRALPVILAHELFNLYGLLRLW